MITPENPARTSTPIKKLTLLLTYACAIGHVLGAPNNTPSENFPQISGFINASNLGHSITLDEAKLHLDRLATLIVPENVTGTELTRDDFFGTFIQLKLFTKSKKEYVIYLLLKGVGKDVHTGEDWNLMIDNSLYLIRAKDVEAFKRHLTHEDKPQ